MFFWNGCALNPSHAWGIGPGDAVFTTLTLMLQLQSNLYSGATPMIVDIESTYNIVLEK